MGITMIHCFGFGLCAIGTLSCTAHGGDPIYDETSVIVADTILRGYPRFADLNGDGHQDFILGYSNSPTIFRVAMGTGDGDAGVATTYSIVEGDETQIQDVVPCDLDYDGDMDLVALVKVVEYGEFDAFQTAHFQAYENDGSGSFDLLGTLSPVSTDFYDTGVVSYLVRVGDFDGDGVRDEFAVSDTNNRRIRFYSWSSGWFWDGTLSFFVNGGAEDFSRIDYDGDGDDDLAILFKSSNSVSVRRNDGGFVFSEAITRSTGDRPIDLAVGDIDGDTHPDLLIYNKTTIGVPDSISVYRNGGDTFSGGEAAIDIGHGGSTSVFVISRMALGDLDQDGDVDLVFDRINGFDDKELYLNDGNGAFVFEEAHFMEGHTVSLVDLNGDGGLDLVSSSFNGSPRVLLNEISNACAADLTGDGNLDFFDISAFLTDTVDFNDDTSFDFFDISAFLNAFMSGCP